MLKDHLTHLMSTVNGCSAILVYDTNKESAIFRVGELTDTETSAIKQNISLFNSSLERTEKLCKTSSFKTIMAFYNHHQLFIFSKRWIVFIVVASSEANAGMIFNLKTYLEPLANELLATSSLNEVASGLSSSLPSTSMLAASNSMSSSTADMQQYGNNQQYLLMNGGAASRNYRK
jgi:hypothetical protein